MSTSDSTPRFATQFGSGSLGDVALSNLRNHNALHQVHAKEFDRMGQLHVLLKCLMVSKAFYEHKTLGVR